MRYNVVKADTVDNLCEEVNLIIATNVEFIGGPFRCGEKWAQAYVVLNYPQGSRGEACLTSVM
jgi:hypothetical protein